MSALWITTNWQYLFGISSVKVNWRIKTGLEVDFILGSAEVAIEVKTGLDIDKSGLKGLAAFCQEQHPRVA